MTSASSLVTYDGSPSSSWPLPPDSEVLNMSAYLFRLCQSRMSGYLSAIHCGTNQPMMPSLPVTPASSTDFCSVMYFFTRSSWPQFSTIVSMSPDAMPCQPTSSLTSG